MNKNVVLHLSGCLQELAQKILKSVNIEFITVYLPLI